MELRPVQAQARELPRAAGGGPPESILLMPAGELVARDGRRWRHDDPQAVLARTRERAGSTDLVIDYEHQTDYAPLNGRSAPAAGWIRELEARAGELWGRVEWTARAREHLAAREYRYLSPTFLHDEAGRVVALQRAALTNNPALEMPAMARQEGDAMTPAQLAALVAALALPAGSDPDAAIARAKELVAGAVPDRAGLAAALGLAEDATGEELVAAAKARAEAKAPAAAAAGPPAGQAGGEGAAPNVGDYVPRAEFDRVSSALAGLEERTAMAAAEAAVEAATAAGKLAPGLRDWGLTQARTNPEEFAKFVAAAPAIVGPGAGGASLQAGAPPSGPDAPLTPAEKAMARQMGIKEESFREARAADLARTDEEAHA